MAINTVAKAAGQCKKSKRGKELSKFFPPNSSDDLCLFFCLYPSSMVQVQAWGKDPQRKRERKSDRQWRRARKREKLMLSKFANIYMPQFCRDAWREPLDGVVQGRGFPPDQSSQPGAQLGPLQPHTQLRRQGQLYTSTCEKFLNRLIN